MNSFRFAHFRNRILAEEVLKKSEFEAPLLARARFHFAQFQQEDAKSNSCAHPKHEKKKFMRCWLPPLTPSPILLLAARGEPSTWFPRGWLVELYKYANQ